VFIDFTARWCLSCQVHDRVAFSNDRVRQRFSELGIVALKADWTTRDATITAALASYGRNSVPVYVLYGSNPAEEPVFLPEVLTPGIVLDALAKLDEPALVEQMTKG
jgi:thiol:disulfide interchange protein DsbD